MIFSLRVTFDFLIFQKITETLIFSSAENWVSSFLDVIKKTTQVGVSFLQGEKRASHVKFRTESQFKNRNIRFFKLMVSSRDLRLLYDSDPFFSGKSQIFQNLTRYWSIFIVSKKWKISDFSFGSLGIKKFAKIIFANLLCNRFEVKFWPQNCVRFSLLWSRKYYIQGEITDFAQKPGLLMLSGDPGS